MISLDQEVALLKGNDEFQCPYCDHTESVSDIDVCQSVVSVWGDEHHDYSCPSCGEDYIVVERVTRTFEAHRTLPD